jgi:HEAT repeat protein
MIGDVALAGALPTLQPLAVVVHAPSGLELRSLGAPMLSASKVKVSRAARGASAVQRMQETARRVGAPPAAISLFEVREEMASAFAGGLAGLAERTTEPLAARLRDLALPRQAEVIDSLLERTDPAERLEDFVKIYRVLEVALVRLLGTTKVDTSALERVPSYESVTIDRIQEPLPPGRVTALCARGEMSRYEAAVHYGRYCARIPATELASRIELWADGNAGPHIARALEEHGAEAIRAARSALAPHQGRVARLTAVRVLEQVKGREAEALLETVAEKEEDSALRDRAADALARLRRDRGIPVERRRTDARERIAHLSQMLLAGSNKDTRIQAARDLVKLHDMTARSVLRMSFMGDVSADVREAAALALAELGDTEMVETFVRLLRDRHHNEGLAKVAAHALGHLGDIRGAEELLAAYREGWKPPIVSAALKAIGASAIEPLVDLLEARPEIAKKRAALSVLEVLPEDALAFLLIGRIEAIKTGGGELASASAEKLELYLKLASVHEGSRTGVARRIIELFSDVPGLAKPVLSKAKKQAAR